MLAILATISIPTFQKAVSRTRDKEAISMLRLIGQAEEIYFLELDTYVNCNSAAACNTALRLSLSARNWTYSVTGGGGGWTARARSTAANPPNRNWTYTKGNADSDADPTCSGCI